MENTPEQTAEGTAVVRVLATVLERLVNSNANVDHGQGHVTKFHALKAPGISILQYLERIHKYSSCSTECFILALIYIDRLIQRANFILTELNVHRVVITSVLLAAKFFDDAYYNNAYYAKVGGVLVSEMNGLEVEFLFRINFSLHVTPEMFAKYQAELVSHATSPEDNDGSECSIINNNGNGTIPQSQAQPLLQQQPQRNVCAPLDTMIGNTTKQDSSILMKGRAVQQQQQPVALDTMVNEIKEQDASILMDCMTQESVYDQQPQEENNQHKYNQNPAITSNEMEVYQQQQEQPTVTMYVPQRHITPSPPQVQNRRAQIGAEEQLQEFASKLNQTQTTSYPNYQNTAKNMDILIRHHSYPTVNNINNQHSTTVGFEVRPYSDFEQTEVHTATKASLHHHPISEPPLFTSCSSSNNHFSQYPEINTFGHTSISPNTSSPHYVKQNW